MPADVQDARLELIPACQHKVLALCVPFPPLQKKETVLFIFIYLFYELKAW